MSIIKAKDFLRQYYETGRIKFHDTTSSMSDGRGSLISVSYDRGTSETQITNIRAALNILSDIQYAAFDEPQFNMVLVSARQILRHNLRRAGFEVAPLQEGAAHRA